MDVAATGTAAAAGLRCTVRRKETAVAVAVTLPGAAVAAADPAAVQPREADPVAVGIPVGVHTTNLNTFKGLWPHQRPQPFLPVFHPVVALNPRR